MYITKFIKKIVFILFGIFLISFVHASPPSGCGKLVWHDEFNTNKLDLTKWHHHLPGLRRDAINVKEAISLDGSNLIITVSEISNIYYTGMISTQPSFQQTYGYWECRMTLPKTIGYWTAFWIQSPNISKLTGDTAASGTEIDVVEYLLNMSNKVQHTLHWDGYGKEHKSKVYKAKIDTREGFHTFGVMWTPDRYTFYVDGVQTWSTTQAISKCPEYVILSSEVGKWGGDISQAKLPDSVYVDYVRVYDVPFSEPFHSNWKNSLDRIWVGPEYWANRLQDWRVQSGTLICIESRNNKPMRTVHLLTRRLGKQKGNLEMSVETGMVGSNKNVSQDSATGFLIGAGRLLDYRAAALIHHSPGPGGGIFAGITGKGQLFIRDFSISNEVKFFTKSEKEIDFSESISLFVSVKPVSNNYSLTLSCHDIKNGKKLDEIVVANVKSERFQGSIALVSNPGTGKNTKSYYFREWKISGSKIIENEDRTCGPVICAQYTLSRKILKLTAQFMPIGNYENRTVKLQIKKADQWKTIAITNILIPSWTATFRVDNWHNDKEVPYRVVYELNNADKKSEKYFYYGTVRREPINKETIVVAGFTGNHNVRKFGVDRGSFEWSPSSIWFPHNDIIKHVKTHNPDLLFFSGDQVYESSSPTRGEKRPVKKAVLDYLYKWYLWCWAYRDIVKDIPTVTIPDDHDVFQGNLWGAGGRHTDIQEKGGYVMPAEFVKMVERTQTSHLPDPYDPTFIEQGIGVYYSSMNYGGISFAIIEDRKFKEPCVIKNADGQNIKVKNPKLLGNRQLKFLSNWAADWSDGVCMKSLLSQTIFVLVSTASTTPQPKYGGYQPLPPDVYPPDKFRKDVDSNASNPEGKNKALREIRKGFAFHIAGDTHLGSITHYGVDDFNDAGYAFCVPSIANFYPRRWYPPTQGKNRKPGSPKYTGEFTDLYGNKMTVYAASNPVLSGHKPTELYNCAPGYGIIKFNKSDRKITMECWPRWEDPTKQDAKQYLGWPKTIDQMDNYGRKAVAYLPTIEVTGMTNPVVQIINEKNNEIVYTLRVNGNSFKAKVFEKGSYTIKIGEPGAGKMKMIKKIQSIKAGDVEKIKVVL